ncbi:hypothetical protein WMF31_20215 [Sorangium sp. So ce1036]|uniref:hypothetical protein n=1 Tax=Sorangium sp. So ce1036 TaxID=3133328 RepID=UPI003F121066
MTSLAVILYEDQRGPEKEFGLHNLVVACVADDTGKDRFALRRELDGRPMKGVQNLLRSCRRDICRLSSRGQQVFALIDDDAIRHQLKHEGVSESAEDAAVVRAIKEKCGAPERLHVVLLKENTETVIQAAEHCDKGLTRSLVAQALQKDVNARDAIFNRISWQSDRAVRDCIRQRVEAIQEIVKALITLVRGGDGSI